MTFPTVHDVRIMACRDADPELFFPTATVGPAFEAQAAEALAHCAVCPVREACLDHALARLPEGIAGGTTADERRRIRAGRREGRRQPITADMGPTVPGERARRRARGVELLRAGRLTHAEIAREVGASVRAVNRWSTAPDTASARTTAIVNAPDPHSRRTLRARPRARVSA